MKQIGSLAKEVLENVAIKRRATYVDQHVGRMLRLQRAKKGVSQEALASKTGITFQQIQKYENASNRIPAGRLYELSEALNVPIMDFFEGLESQTSSQEDKSITDFMLTNEGISLNKGFTKLENPRDRKTVLTLIRVLSRTKESKNDE